MRNQNNVISLFKLFKVTSIIHAVCLYHLGVFLVIQSHSMCLPFYDLICGWRSLIVQYRGHFFFTNSQNLTLFFLVVQFVRYLLAMDIIFLDRLFDLYAVCLFLCIFQIMRTLDN